MAETTTLAQALLLAQQAVGAVPKAKEAEVKKRDGSFAYTYKYAAGEDMISAARSALLENGLTWSLVAYEIDHGNPPTLRGSFMLEHPESQGQRVYTFPMPIASTNHADKALAGALTYLTSYALRGVLNIPREDPNEPDRRTSETAGVGFGAAPKATRRRKTKPPPNLIPMEALAKKIHEITGKGTPEGAIRWAEQAFIVEKKRAPDYGKAADVDAVSVLLAGKLEELSGPEPGPGEEKPL